MPRNTTLYKLAGTDTFRAASTAFFGYGTNLQNISKDMRRMYEPDEGKIFVQVDQSGAEALIVAYLCEKGRFRDLFLHGVKPHVFVGMHLFLDKWKILCKDIDVDSFASTPIPELKKKDGWKVLDKVIKESDNWKAAERYYYIAKMICHASNYAMKAAAFQLNVLIKSQGTIVLTKEQAGDYLLRYHSLFPEITRWHRQVEQQINTTGMLYNLFGYPAYAVAKPTESDMKKWYAFAPQSTVGIITHIEVTQEQLYIETTQKVNTVHSIGKLPEPVVYCLDTYGTSPADWDILANTHDSSMTQASIEDALRCAKVKLHLFCMELTSLAGEKFRMKAEAQAGYNWSPYKKELNERGLKEIEGL